MKLERLHEYILPVVAIGLGIFTALYCGKLVGQGQTGTLALILMSILATGVALVLRERIWVMIPLLLPFSGQLLVLPLPFSIFHLTAGFVFVATLVLIAAKVIRRKHSFSALDILLIINLLYLVTVYIRNPVGTNALGSTRVGGKPYFEIAVSFLAYLVLSRASASVAFFRLVPFVSFLGNLGQAFIGFLTFNFPQTVPLIGSFYTAISTENFDATDVGIPGTADGYRHMYLHYSNVQGASLLCSWFNPRTIINPLFIKRFILFIILLISILFTGFRSAFAALGFYFLISTYVRTGWMGLFRLGIISVPVLGALLILQGNFIQLPKSAQRALSFLPGKWSDEAIGDAKSSTQWRVEMWKEMLLTDRYIASKWLGDGFGFSAREMQIQESFRRSGIGTQEYFMLTGGVHSGPISAIRYVGYLGLGLYLLLTVLMAKEAYHLIKRARGTPALEPVLFFSLPIIYDPFGFIFIFGGLDGNFPQTLIYLGYINLMRNVLADHMANKAEVDSESRHPSWKNVPRRKLVHARA